MGRKGAGAGAGRPGARVVAAGSSTFVVSGAGLFFGFSVWGGEGGALTLFPVRPFLIQSDLSAENGRFRLNPKSSFLILSKKGFFDSIFFD